MLSTLLQPICSNHSLNQVQFSKLNLCYCSITNLSQTQIPTKLLFITQLYLDNNLIKQLKGIQSFMNIQVLSVNFNFISQKKQILRLRNRFLVKNILVIGNPIQKEMDNRWLKQNGFSNIVGVNEIKDIGRVFVDKDKVCSFQVRVGNNPSNRQYNNKIYEQKFNNSTNKKSLNNMNSEDDQKTKRIVINSHYNQQHQNHQQKNNLYQTNRRRNYLYQFNQNPQKGYNLSTAAQYRNSKNQRNAYFDDQAQLYSFINTNYRRDKYYQNSNNQIVSNNGHSPRRVKEFVLYPENQYHYNQSNERYANNKILKRSNVNVHPFQQTKQTNHYVNSGHSDRYLNTYYRQNNNYSNSNSNSSKKHQAYPHKMMDYHNPKYNNNQYNNKPNNFKNPKSKRLTSSQQSQKPTSSQHTKTQNSMYFKQLLYQRGQIPLYKQAIAIAFYYRNLLEKVFRGLYYRRRQQKQEEENRKKEEEEMR